MTMTMRRCVGGSSISPRSCRRVVVPSVFLVSLCVLGFLLNVFGQENRHERAFGGGSGTTSPATGVPRCGQDRGRPTQGCAWNVSTAERADLIQDKFTMTISTFHRPKELGRVLDTVLSDKLPSLFEVVVVWNNFGETPPPDFTSDHGVPVRYRTPAHDSLNEKLRPDPGYRTAAILLSDDDVFYRPSDLEFVFQIWREFGQDRLVGALARCISSGRAGDRHADARGSWEYNFCTPSSSWGGGDGDGETYSMVLTNLAFTHVSFLDHYFSDAGPAVRMRQVVDDAFNCEDIAFNYMVSYLTGRGPLLVRGRDQYVNMDPPAGISRNKGHLEARGQCLNDFAQILGCMPLVDVKGRMERGFKHNVWYKSVWDLMTL
ncbi:Exostosin-3 [Emericellopsis cladophorae]|uniref:Exostosin-3 n=1 Tax=Emericellopsis cladophorae TaxID=2686198 RepID=A0A9P9Y4H3_9HYPO|nr:Exostosin-3 [Emericellopsis cladophorae]KAI6782774.1 Exostosin-3 [Emericellopsis cladophorae]